MGSILSIRTQWAGPALIAFVVGELDSEAIRQLRAELHAVHEWNLDLVIIDLRSMTRIGEEGLSAILEAEADARESGWDLVVIRAPAEIDDIFAETGTDEHLLIMDDLLEVVGVPGEGIES
jgi:anti-anti-sigma regulatory factor